MRQALDLTLAPSCRFRPLPEFYAARGCWVASVSPSGPRYTGRAAEDHLGISESRSEAWTAGDWLAGRLSRCAGLLRPHCRIGTAHGFRRLDAGHGLGGRAWALHCLPLATQRKLWHVALGGPLDSFSSRNHRRRSSFSWQHTAPPAPTVVHRERDGADPRGVRVRCLFSLRPRLFRRLSGALPARLLDGVPRAARRRTAEDVVQDVFTTIWRHPDKFDPQRGSLPGYVAMMAGSRAVDRVRSRNAGSAAADRLAVLDVQREQGVESPADAVMRRHEAGLVLAAVAELPAAQRDAVLMAYGRGLSTAEIAKAAGVPLGTAKSRLVWVSSARARPSRPRIARRRPPRARPRPDRDRLQIANRDRFLSPTPPTRTGTTRKPVGLG